MELIAVVALIVGGTLAFTRNEVKQVARKLAQIRRTAIAALPDEKFAAARGAVTQVEDELLVAPLSGRRCVFWFVLFEEVGADAEELGRAQQGQPFLLVADKHAVRVVPSHALRPAITVKQSTSKISAQHFYLEARMGRDWTDPVMARLGQLALAVCRSPNHAGTLLRVSEYVVAPGDTITVVGWVTREPDPTAAEDVTGYRSAPPTRPVLSGTKRKKLMIGA